MELSRALAIYSLFDICAMTTAVPVLKFSVSMQCHHTSDHRVHHQIAVIMPSRAPPLPPTSRNHVPDCARIQRESPQGSGVGGGFLGGSRRNSSRVSFLSSLAETAIHRLSFEPVSLDHSFAYPFYFTRAQYFVCDNLRYTIHFEWSTASYPQCCP
ncbi:hypothetical protein C2E23DRAFT_849463 [Lenzites betulinus]|nr:hypothetical protein C2E23DRAFT_849463 [Lenzites betulinus]